MARRSHGVAVWAILVIGLAGCRDNELDRKADVERALTAAASSSQPTPPPETAESAAGPESEATFEFKVPTERPARTDDYPAAEQRPPDYPEAARQRADPQKCILATAQPTMTSAYGRSGEVIHLAVRAQNGCSTHFEGATFRVAALAPDGREVGSASGRFYGGIPPGGSADTLIVIPVAPSLDLTYRAEVTGY